MRIVADIIEYTARHMPKFNSISISGYHMQEAGATQALELAFTLADGKEYVRAALARGMDVDDFAGRLSFFFGIGMNFYLEIAKLRAARLLWWRIMKEFKPKNPKSMMLRTHCQTSGWSLTEQDPYNNVVRTAIEAHGRGVRRHAVAAHQLVRRGDRAADRLLGAHRAQHPAHPAGRDAHHARDRSLGRLVHDGEADAGHGRSGLGDHRGSRGDGRHDQGRASPAGPSSRSKQCAAEKQARIDRGDDVIVGVNKYRLDEEEPIEIREIDNTAVREAQLRRLSELRARSATARRSPRRSMR